MINTLRGLADQMPTRRGEVLHPLIDHLSIDLAPTEPEGYVWPDLEGLAKADDSPIVLVTAPGAMGKSAAAKALAAVSNSPYIDLSRIQVGAGTLTGEITKLLGWKAAGEYFEDLRFGRASLVLDSTDEAQLRAGRDNYLAFLADLKWVLEGAAGSSQVVLLGRRDSIDNTRHSLASIDFGATVYAVKPLDRRQSCELIDSALDAKVVNATQFAVHRTHKVPFGGLRDRLFSDIAKVLVETKDGQDYWPAARNFLGYPPVLLALAERLAVDNPQSELVALEISGETGARQGALLRAIVESILDREAEKVRSKLGDKLGFSREGTQRDVLYTREEQVTRLLRRTGGRTLDVQLPASLTVEEFTIYEESVEGFLSDHPFLSGSRFANVVFSDYVTAWAVSSPVNGVFGGSRRSFLSSLPRVGPFFAYFLHSLRQVHADFGDVPEDLVDATIKSFLQGDATGQWIFTQRGELGGLSLQSGNPLVPSEDAMVFVVTELSGVLQLSSPLARGLCITEYWVHVSGAQGNVEMGPGLMMVADQIEFQADTIAVAGNSQADSVLGPSYGAFLTANSVSHSTELRVSAYPDSALMVNWPDVWHQWKPFVFSLPSNELGFTSAVSSQVQMGIRRILIAFGSSGGDAPSVYPDKIERFAVGSNDVFQATFAALKNLGVIEKGDGMYRLRLQALSDFGVIWTTLRGNDPGRSLASLHEAVLADVALAPLRIVEN